MSHEDAARALNLTNQSDWFHETISLNERACSSARTRSASQGRNNHFLE